MTIEFTLPEGTVFCTRCGFRPAPAPKTIDIDPLCDPCSYAVADEDSLPMEFNNDEGGCPGYGDSCGNLLSPTADLCPDCTMARLDAESPRIPR